MNIVEKCGLIWVISSLLIELLELGLPAKDTHPSWEELIKYYPHIKSIEGKVKRVTLIGLITTFFVAAICIYISLKSDSTDVFAIIFLVMALSGIGGGIISLMCRVYSFGYKYAVKYFYDENKEYTIIPIYMIFISTIATAWIIWILIDFSK